MVEINRTSQGLSNPLQETCWMHNVYMHIKIVWEDEILILGNLQLRTAKRIEISRTYLN